MQKPTTMKINDAMSDQDLLVRLRHCNDEERLLRIALAKRGAIVDPNRSLREATMWIIDTLASPPTAKNDTSPRSPLRKKTKK